MQINYADEVIDFLTLLEVPVQAILAKDDEDMAEWLYDMNKPIVCFMLGKHRTKDVEPEDMDFLQAAKNIKNKLLESKE